MFNFDFNSAKNAFKLPFITFKSNQSFKFKLKKILNKFKPLK